MGHTKGEWRISPVFKSGATISIRIGVKFCDWGIGDFSRVLPNNRYDDRVEVTHIANAQRIVDCVNGCDGLNPQAVRDMYEALDDFGSHLAVNYDAHDNPYYYINQEWLDKRNKALAKARGE